jgi:hypothetical protein
MGFRELDTGLADTGSDIRKIGKVDLMKTFPHYFKFSEGLLRYRISCYDPHLIQHVIVVSTSLIKYMVGPFNVLKTTSSSSSFFFGYGNSSTY